MHPALTLTYKNNSQEALTRNDISRFAIHSGLSDSWVEDDLEAARRKAELLTVLPNPGILVTNIDSRAPPLRTDSVGLE